MALHLLCDWKHTCLKNILRKKCFTFYKQKIVHLKFWLAKGIKVLYLHVVLPNTVCLALLVDSNLLESVVFVDALCRRKNLQKKIKNKIKNLVLGSITLPKSKQTQNRDNNVLKTHYPKHCDLTTKNCLFSISSLSSDAGALHILQFLDWSLFWKMYCDHTQIRCIQSLSMCRLAPPHRWLERRSTDLKWTKQVVGDFSCVITPIKIVMMNERINCSLSWIF